MKVRRHKNKNEYLVTPEGFWVRNFTRNFVPRIDINESIPEHDFFPLLKNEYRNNGAKMPWIDSEKLFFSKVVIVSDGFQFSEKHKLLADMPQNVCILGVNRALKKWEVSNRNMNFYVVNNPYQECLLNLPRSLRTWPKCIASVRTNFEFLEHYRGTKYRYAPVPNVKYSGMPVKGVDLFIDDYRNPICAALALAYQFGAEKILLLCCDDTFADERPGAEKLHNDRWMYPQQRTVHNLIDANLYWLRTNNRGPIAIADHSAGPYYENAAYIEESEIFRFLGIDAANEQ